MTSLLRCDRSGADAVADARDQEEEHDDEQQAVHERRIADDVAGFGIAQRRARRKRREQHDHQHAQEAEERKAQAARLGGRGLGRPLLVLLVNAAPPPHAIAAAS